jgi:hypothetical protein
MVSTLAMTDALVKLLIEKGLGSTALVAVPSLPSPTAEIPPFVRTGPRCGRELIEKTIVKSAILVQPKWRRQIWKVLGQKLKSPREIKGFLMERVRRVELPTLCLASIRSSQLSYTRIQCSRT